jgi:hypothetical protein
MVPAQQRAEHSLGSARLILKTEARSAAVPNDREKISTGPNERAINENIA